VFFACACVCVIFVTIVDSWVGIVLRRIITHTSVKYPDHIYDLSTRHIGRGITDRLQKVTGVAGPEFKGNLYSN
jgi:hypothetical protein